MFITVTKIKTKSHVKLPRRKKCGNFLSLPVVDDNSDYCLVCINQLHDGKTVDSLVTLIEFDVKKTFNHLKKNLENIAYYCLTLSELVNRMTSLSGEGFKFIPTEPPTTELEVLPGSTTFLYYEENQIVELIKITDHVKHPVKVDEIPTLTLTGTVLPSYLMESYQSKVCGLNGTYWVQVKTEKGRREEAYHLKGDVKHIPERLVLRDLPTPTSHDEHYSFNERVLEYVGIPESICVSKDNFFLSTKGLLYFKLGAALIELGKLNFKKYFINPDVNGYLTIMLSRHRRFGSLWDNGPVLKPIEYLLTHGILVQHATDDMLLDIK